MGDYGIYKGANYGFDPENEPLIPSKYRLQPSQFGLALDPRTANQLKEVTNKLNTGAKTIEVQGLTGEIVESIPDQHFQEIARLKKLIGADITFHGPLIEPTGINQQGWDETQRIQAEKQIWDAVKRGQQMMLKNVEQYQKEGKAEYEDNNLVVTLHTSNGLMAPTMKMKDEKTGEIKITNVAVIDEASGKAGYIPQEMLEGDKFEDGEKAKFTDPKEVLEKLNERFWQRDLNNIATQVLKGREVVQKALTAPRRNMEDEESLDLQSRELTKVKELFNLYHKDQQEYNNAINAMSDPIAKTVFDNKVTNLAHAEGYIRDSYDAMKQAYVKAKEAFELQKQRGSEAEKQEAQRILDELENFRHEAAEKLKQYKDDKLKIKEFGEEVEKGVRFLETLKAPQQYRLLEEFAVEKASQTFAGVAEKAYSQFKDNAPILSLENPPAGPGGGLNRAEEIKKLVEATRTELAKRLKDNQGLTETEAKAAAQKLIGVTWDVGHINMIKKYGFTNEDLKKETETIKPFLKHVHLSDNFGLEHTELPMGMGNVPMKEHLAEIGDKIKGMKAIIETGNWYQHFQTSPLPETLAAFGSPIYPMQMQPYWDRSQAQVGNYFAGYGFNPEIHHSIYGAGFSGLPTELGGQVGGGRNRLSGAPME